MMASLKSEFRKLLSVRSTYVVSILALLLTGGLMAFYVEGFWGKSGSAAGSLTELALREVAMNALSSISIFVAIVATLQVVHEYRHNTIMYTLTASNSRTKAFISKVIAVLSYTVVFATICMLVSVVMYLLGVALRGGVLPAQDIDWLSVLGRGLFLNVAYALIGLIVAYLSRNIALAIAVLLIIPSTVEPLLGILLKDNAKYLPFNALNNVVLWNPEAAGNPRVLAFGTAVAVSLAYLAFGLIVTWYLFLRRDAN